MTARNRCLTIVVAAALAGGVMALPRPEATEFEVSGPGTEHLVARVAGEFVVSEDPDDPQRFRLVARKPNSEPSPGDRLSAAAESESQGVKIEHVDGLSRVAHRFLAALVFLVVLFVLEPLPLPITAVCIGVVLVAIGVNDPKQAWSAYMHPVVVFIMCCLIFAIALDKAGLTRRLGRALARRANGSVVKFTFIIAIGLGLASSVMHDAAATAVGIAITLPLLRAAGVRPNTNTARFVMLAIPFACTSGGMGTLVGGGRCMVAAAFLEEFTGIEISFFDWMIFAMPVAVVMVPAAVALVYFVYRPDRDVRLPPCDATKSPWSKLERRTVWILLAVFGLWLTKGLHGIDYSVTGMLGVAVLVLAGILNWEDIHQNLEWGTALFIFGGGLALGLAMDSSGAAHYFAGLFFPLVRGYGWLVLFIGVGLFGALVTNVMANVAAAALILPIVIPLAELEGVDPRVIALCLGMATSFAMLLVIGCPPNAIAYSFGQFRARDLTRAGLVAMPVLLAILTGAAALWWSVLGLV
jgi:sodium-dependent dicarboxylate transporter 2/3/5